MILSASRRTDIPNYYSEWFFQRIKEGFLYVRNPMNPGQISRIDLSPDIVDCIVFWTKNPGPMLASLDRLKDYPFYFQFTLTGYGRDIEANIPHKKEKIIPIFKKLSDLTGSERVVWRYDPILFNKVYDEAYHRKAFSQIAGELRGYTHKCVISFLDIYKKNIQCMKHLNIYRPDESILLNFAKGLSETAAQNGMVMTSCAEKMDLTQAGILHGSCIDRQLIEQLAGCRLNVRRDQNQRQECGCIESVDIGAYDTCSSGCAYCYANESPDAVRSRIQKYDPESPLLCGLVMNGDRIIERKLQSFREVQISMFDSIY